MSNHSRSVVIPFALTALAASAFCASARAGQPTATAKPATTRPAAQNTDARIVALTARMIATARKTRSGECTFRRKEFKGKPLPETVALSKFRRGGDIMLRNLKGPNEGRDILFRPGKNDDKILVSNPVINLSLDPDGFIARRGSRYSIRKAGLIAAAQRIMRTAKQLDALPADAARHEWIGPRMVRGQKTLCYRSFLRKDKYPQLFAYKTEICVSDSNDMPVSSTVWDKDKKGDKDIRQVGQYTFEKCRFNHLTDVDFDEDNPEYKF